MSDIETIISLYKKFDKYKKYKDIELLLHILPSYILKQCKLHKQGDEVIGFTNWAYLNDATEKVFIDTGEIELDQWNSGNNLWHVDTVCVKNLNKIMAWTKKYFTEKFGSNHPINWLRISNEHKIYRKATRLTKESWK